MNNLPTKFGIITGKSCERSITLQYLKKLIKITNDSTYNKPDKYICYNSYDEFKMSTSPCNFVIIDEEECLEIDPSLPLYSVSYNSDRVSLIRHTVNVKSETDQLAYMERVNAVFENVSIYPEKVNNECDAIVFTKLPPTPKEYYEYIRSIISRANYKDRAKGGVGVHTYFLITPGMINSYNKFVGSIIERDKRYNEIKSKIKYSISLNSNKVEITETK